jgi:hypothetical protein
MPLVGDCGGVNDDMIGITLEDDSEKKSSIESQSLRPRSSSAGTIRMVLV